MIGRGVGWSFQTARDAVARFLIRLGVTPNALTLAGMVVMVATGVCYALGTGKGFGWSLDPRADRTAYLLLAGAGIFLASACDMLDGAVARLSDKKTAFGGFLDSTLDRFSDFVVFAGIALAYAAREPANLTFVLGAMLAFFHAFMISYARARAEDLIEACRVGFWQRGERSAAILIATWAHHIPALIAQQAILPMLTALRRMFYTRAVLAGRKPVTDPRQGTWRDKVKIWTWPRMTVPYDITVALNIAWLLFADFQPPDPVRVLLGM